MTASVEMVREEANNAQPALVRVSITNASDESANEFATGWPGVFAARRSDERDPGLMLTPADDEYSRLRHPLCPKPIRKKAVPAGLHSPTIAPGQTVIVTFAVWGQLGNGPFDCVPPGTYTVTSTYHSGPKLEHEFG